MYKTQVDKIALMLRKSIFGLRFFKMKVMRFMFSKDNYVVFPMLKRNCSRKNINQLFNNEKVELFLFWKVSIIIMKVNTV